MKGLLLIVEDEQSILDILQFNLEREGYRTETAMDGQEAVAKAKQLEPDLILLDVMIPIIDGFEVCKMIRTFSQAPIIMLTARTEEVDKVLGLELGADDYMTKPFSMRELMARIKANMRRIPAGTAQTASDVLVMGDLTIDCEQYEIRRGTDKIELTLREFELVRFLAAAPNKVFSRETLLGKVWGYEYIGDVRTVDVTVRRLREKLERNPAEPEYVITKRGVGYYFSADSGKEKAQ